MTVLEAQARILQRGVPAEIAAILHKAHADHGVRILCGQAIASMTETARGVAIRLADGGLVEADLVVVGIGAKPNIELAEAAGLAIDNGIAVDDRLRTSDPHIFAAGDCCSFPLALYGGRRVRLEAWRNALEQGPLAALNMLGRDQTHTAVPWFWSDQYDLGLQVAGLLMKLQTLCDATRATAASFCSTSPPTDGLWRRAESGRAHRSRRDFKVAEMLIARRRARRARRCNRLKSN